MADFEIKIDPVQVLAGHVDPDSAYVVDDYPYRRKCKIRYWVETAGRGAKKGDQRWMSQRTNPRVAGDVWNKPKGSTYSAQVIMYLDQKGHVQAHHVDVWVSPEHDAWARMVGLVDQLDEETRKFYDVLVKHSQYGRGAGARWVEFEEKITVLADHIRETGQDPEFTNGVYTRPSGGMKYIGGYGPVLVALARERVSG